MATFSGLGSALVFFGGAADESFGHLVLSEVEEYRVQGTFGSAEIHYLPWTSAAFWSRRAVELVKSLAGQTIGLIGHSYGGHSAYVTAEKAGVPIAYLATIDGVSWGSKLFSEGKPEAVKRWRNVWVKGVQDYTDVIALLGGRWGEQRDAENMAAPEGSSHAEFGRMFRPLIPELKSSVAATLIA